MKKRRFTFVAFLLCAIMTLTVGFAELTDAFKIEGHAIITEDAAEDVLNNDVYFAGIVVGGALKSDVLSTEGLGYTASVNVADDSASFHITGLTAKDEVKAITFRIQNDFDREVTIKSLNKTLAYQGTADDLQVFSVDYSLAENATIAAEGGTIDVVVTVTVLKTPARDVSADFTLTFNAEVAPLA